MEWLSTKQCPHGPLRAYRPSPILVTEGTQSFTAETLVLGGTAAAKTQVPDHRPSSFPVPCSRSSAARDQPPPRSSILQKLFHSWVAPSRRPRRPNPRRPRYHTGHYYFWSPDWCLFLQSFQYVLCFTCLILLYLWPEESWSFHVI